MIRFIEKDIFFLTTLIRRLARNPLIFFVTLVRHFRGRGGVFVKSQKFQTTVCHPM